MDIETYEKASELYGRYRLCEDVMAYLSDPDAGKNYRYKNLLAKFAEAFQNDFMMFVHSKMTESGEKFEALHCCPEPPAEPENPDNNGGAADPDEGE